MNQASVAPPWPRAVTVLCRLVASRVTTTVQTLRSQIRAFDANFPQWQHCPQARSKWADDAARRLVFALISGDCDCGRHRRGCRPAQCGCRCCVRDHALARWLPDSMPLGVFLANAVRGSAAMAGRQGGANRVVWGDAFSRSMLRPVLDGDGLEPVVIAEVEFRRCASCQHRFERPAGDDVCTTCGRPDRAAVNRREVMRHVILYPEAGGYQRVRRVECHACGGYFDTGRVAAGSGCPLAGCGSKQQLKCPHRGCTRWREVDKLTSPCEGCGERFTIRCPQCGDNRTVHDILAGQGDCGCGQGLLDAFNDRRLQLCRTRAVWVH